jgi:hypothetical protein
MPTPVYKVGESYYRADNNQKILNPTELKKLNPVLVEKIPGAQYGTREAQQAAYTNIQPIGNTLYGTPRINAMPTIKRSGTDILVNATQAGNSDLDQWKSGVNLVEEARKIIQMKQNYNNDIQSAKQVWGTAARDTSAWGSDQKQFSELSPAEQASIRAKQYATAEAHLSGLADEEKYRGTRTEDTLKYISDIYNEKIQELKDQKADANEKQRIAISERQLALEEARDAVNAKRSASLNAKDAYDMGHTVVVKEDGSLVVDDSPYTLPKVNSKVQVGGVGTGTVTAYGSDLWTYGLDIAFDGGKNKDISVPFDFEVLDTGVVHGGFGNQVRIKNNATGEEMWISHLSSFAPLQAGRSYSAGTSVGKQGNTGSTVGKTGIHVDFTMPNGDGTYKSPQEVAVALGIGTANTGAGTGIKMTAEQKKEVLDKTDLTDADIRSMSYADGQAAIKQYKDDTSKTVLTLITDGHKGDGFDIAPLSQQVTTATGKVIKNPDFEVVAGYLFDMFGNILSRAEIESLMLQAGYTKIAGLMNSTYTYNGS